MSIRQREFFIQLWDTRKQAPIDDDSGSYQVYTAGSPDRAAIKDAAGVTLTQEVVGTSFLSQTMTNGQIKFYTAHTVSSVDVSILTAGGRSYFLKGITRSQGRIDVDPDQQNYVLVVGINEKASSTTVRPLGFQLRKGMLVHDVLVKVTSKFDGAALASSEFDLGRSGDADGFIDGVNCSTTGFRQGHPIVSSTGLVAGVKYGVDLAKIFLSSTGNTVGVDHYIKKSYLAKTGVASNNLVYQRGTALTASITAQSGKGYVYYVYTLLPGVSSSL